MILPLSFGIPFGLLIVLVGVILFFATKHKVPAILVSAFGAAVAGVTLILVVLIVNSQM